MKPRALRDQLTQPLLWDTVRPSSRKRQRTGVATTSRDARDCANVAGGRRIVMLALWANQGPMTRNEIAERAGMKLASVCGRVDDLLRTVIDPTTDKRMVYEIRTDDGTGFQRRNGGKLVAPTYYPTRR